MSPRPPLQAALLLVVAACHGGPQPTAPADPRPKQADAPPPARAPAEVPSVDVSPPQATKADGALLTRHVNGVIAIALPGARRGQALVQAHLRAGAEQARPGVAELAAETLVAGSDASSGRRSLRQTVRSLGGALDTDVGDDGIWITARVPSDRWQAAAEAMLAALRDPPESRTQIERLRDDYLDAAGREIWGMPEAAAARALLRGDAGTSAYLANLLDRDASEVRQFLAVYCVPDRTVLSVEADVEAAAMHRALDEAVTAAKWRARSGEAPQTARTQQAARGVFWATSSGDALASTSLVIGIPEADAPRSADTMVLLACLTMDGIGGRFEQLLRERNLGHLQLRPTWQHVGRSSALVLSTRCTPTEARVLWQALDEVRQSLRAVPPNASELGLGLRRAALSTRLRVADDQARLRERVGTVLRQDGAQTVEQRLGALARDGGMSALAAIDDFLAQPTAMVVFGGKPPTGMAGVTTFELLPAGALARLAGAPPTAQAAAGKPWLAPSLEAIGGAELLRRTIGCRATLERRIGGEAALRETLQWRTPDELSRKRELLGATIATDVNAKGASEALDTTRTSLDSIETRRILREQARHPVALLAAHARGELEFRPIAQRDVGGREVLVLEAIGGGFERLRIHVDANSRLVRVVEVWETLESGLRTHVQESWSDYRSVGGLRSPFHCVTELDDGSNRIETVYESWAPLLRGP